MVEGGADMSARIQAGGLQAGFTPLHSAAFMEEDDAIEMLLELGANPNVRDVSGWTPLHMAVNVGSESIVQILLEAGADRNTKDNVGTTPLHAALRSRRHAIARLLGAGP